MQENPTFLQRLFSMNPAVLRGIVVGIFGVITLITGKVIDDSVVDTVVNVILLVLPIIAGIFIRKAVTPNAKVIAFKPDPIDRPEVIHPGEATIEPTVEQKQELYEAGLRPAA